MEITNKMYDVIKWLVVIVSPALVALITGLGQLYGFNSELITGTISLVTVFVGAILQISSATYKAKNKVE